MENNNGLDYTKALSKEGRLMSIDFVEDGLEGLILAREGVFLWQGAEITKKILGKIDDEITQEELDEIKGEYARAISLERHLSDWFDKNKFEGDIMEVIYKDFVDETLLNIQYKMTTNLIWTYDCWLGLDCEGNVHMREELFLDQDAHDKKFGMGKYEKTIEDLEKYAREKHGKK